MIIRSYIQERQHENEISKFVFRKILLKTNTKIDFLNSLWTIISFWNNIRYSVKFESLSWCRYCHFTKYLFSKNQCCIFFNHILFAIELYSFSDETRSQTEKYDDLLSKLSILHSKIRLVRTYNVNVYQFKWRLFMQ